MGDGDGDGDVRVGDETLLVFDGCCLLDVVEETNEELVDEVEIGANELLAAGATDEAQLPSPQPTSWKDELGKRTLVVEEQ